MPKVNDLSALPTAGKHLIIVADVNHALHLRMFDVEGKMVLDSDAKRFTNTWVEYLQQLVPKWWPPHELTEIERISVINAVRNLAGCTYWDELRRVHGRIASLVGELRAVYPHDSRVAHYMPERWASLSRPLIGQRGVVVREIREVLETTEDPELRTSALYFETSLRFQEPIDGRAAVSLAESFARQAPGDKRAGELLFRAAHGLAADWSTLLGLAVVFAIFAGLLATTIGMRRWLKYVVRVGIVLLALFAVALAGFFFLANDMLIATIRYVYDGSAVATVLSRLLTVLGFLPESLSQADRQARAPFIVSLLGHGTFHQLRVLAGTIRAAFAVLLAALSAVVLVVARRRFAEPPTRWPSAIRLGILAFLAVLAAICAVDACLIGFQGNAIRRRIIRDYPDSFPGKRIWGRMVQEEQRPRRAHRRAVRARASGSDHERQRASASVGTCVGVGKNVRNRRSLALCSQGVRGRRSFGGSSSWSDDMPELGVHQSALLTDLALCVNRWRLFSPGWYVCVLAKVQLSPEESEVPGLVAMVNYGRRKQCEVRDEVFHGPPNFVLDVFCTADDQDFLRRRDRFCESGVHEYLVAFDDEPVGLLWHRLDGNCYRLVEPDEDGIIRSHALPNLWVPLESLQDRDWWTVLGCIERGVSRRANLA